jgi:succinate dehydrogenase / fumarate reductase iron-sulfur subunit
VISFRIFRFDPADAPGSAHRTYTLDVSEGTTVLDALHTIKETQDPTLSWRSSCRMAVCGSCGMYINGLPRLACQTQVLNLDSSVVTVGPLPNYAIVRDLVPDLAPLFDKHSAVKPYLLRHDSAEVDRPTGEFLQSVQELQAYEQFTYCIKCGLCVSACPTAATDPEFFGPQALAQAYRYCADSRDDGCHDRALALDRFHGPFQCHLAAACSEACPKGVDPALGIQLLKRLVVKDSFGVRHRAPSRVAPLATAYVAAENIPAPPPRTV